MYAKILQNLLKLRTDEEIQTEIKFRLMNLFTVRQSLLKLISLLSIYAIAHHRSFNKDLNERSTG